MNKIGLIAVLATMLASCTQQNIVETQEVNKEVNTTLTPLSFSEASITTKSSTTIATDGSKIGVFLRGTTGEGYADLSNVSYKLTSSKWGVETAANEIFLSNKTAKVCAYYPYASAVGTDPTAITLTSQVYSDANDLCYKPNQELTNSSSTFSLGDMIRAYAKLKLDIKKDVSYLGVGKVSSITLTGGGIAKTNTINVTTSTSNYGTAVFEATPTLTTTPSPAVNAMNTTDTYSTSFLMVPITADMAASLNVSLMLDDKKIGVDIPLAQLKQMAAGTCYTISLTVKGTTLAFSALSTTDWKAGTTIEPVYPQ